MVPTELVKLMRECDWKMSYSSVNGDLTMRVVHNIPFPLFEYIHGKKSVFEVTPGLFITCYDKLPYYIVSIITTKFDIIIDLIRELDLIVDVQYALQHFETHFLSVTQEYMLLKDQKQELEKLR